MAHETDVDVKRAETRTLEFPAVTVCNANPVKKSALERLAPYNHLLRELLDLEVYGRTEPGEESEFIIIIIIIIISTINIIIIIYCSKNFKLS